MKKSLSLIVIFASFLLMLLIVIALCSDVLFAKETVFAFNDGNIEGAITQFKYPDVLFHCWTNQAFFGKSFGALTLSINALFETILGPFGFRRIGVIITILLAAMAGYWASRQFGRSIYASLAAAVLFLLCGWNFTFPLAGLPVRSLAMMSCLLSLGMLEKARRTQSWILYAAAGGLLGLALSDTLDVGGIFAIACGGYFVISHWPSRQDLSLATAGTRGLKLAIYIAACALIAYQAILVVGGEAFATTGPGSTKSPEERYAWATQWSMPKAETWSLIACDHHGASSRSSDSPYWGGMGRSEGWEQTKQGFRNFRLAGYALGSVPFVFMIYLLVHLVVCKKNELFDEKHRKIILAAIVVAVICLMLSWGRHFPLYRLFHNLPKMSAIRNPDKWLGPFTIFFGVLFAYAVDAFLYSSRHCSVQSQKKISMGFLGTSIIIPLIACATLVYLGVASGVFTGKLQSEGYAALAQKNAFSNAINANLVALIISGACIALVWIFSARKKFSTEKTRAIITLSVAILMTIELSRACVPFVIGQSYATLNRPNPLTDYLDKNRHFGRIKLMPSNAPLINNWRMTYIMAKSYNIFDPVSIREMPADLKLFFDTFANNPFRMWQMGAMRYFICVPGTAKQLLAANSANNQELFVKQLELGAWQAPDKSVVPVQASMTGRTFVEVLEFRAALPMFRFVPTWQTVPNGPEGDKLVLEKLSAPEFNPGAITHIHSDDAPASGKGSIGTVSLVSSSLAKTVIKVSTPGESILFRADRYHPDWKVFIDGEQTELYRTDYLFQAVKVPAGDHEITFSFEPSRKPLGISIAGRLALVSLIVIGTFNSRQKNIQIAKKT